ncbi:helix-turn-helix domain-containing protein [Lysinibacillus sp. NPDC096212]|uniref:helix-turn-helix domain-containing protein n=1 Tax=Lysinibacillus sp. NPDC096212 TaxID=3364135 RepID=UPI00380F6AD5
MIKCNLAVLLAERGLKMADVINDTSLSKTAVRGLYYNQSKGIQFETLQILCDYLNVGPEDIIKNINFEYVVKNKYIEEQEFITRYEINFKLDDKELTDIVQVSISPSNISELFEDKSIPQEIDPDTDIVLVIFYTKKLKQTILSQITEFESNKIEEFLIFDFIETFNLHDFNVFITVDWEE